MFPIYNSSRLVFCLAIAALATGCGTTATITRPGLPDVEDRILASDSQNIYVEKGRPIARKSITDIDHPGNVAATIGTIVTGYGIANIAVGAPYCARGGVAYCVGVFLPAVLGAPIMGWGFGTWINSFRTARPHKEHTESSLVVVPTISVDKKNEYFGASAVMRF